MLQLLRSPLHIPTRKALCVLGPGSCLTLPHHYSSSGYLHHPSTAHGFSCLHAFVQALPLAQNTSFLPLRSHWAYFSSPATIPLPSLCQAPSSLTSPNHLHFLHSVTSVVSDSVSCLVFSLASVSKSHIQAIEYDYP